MSIWKWLNIDVQLCEVSLREGELKSRVSRRGTTI